MLLRFETRSPEEFIADLFETAGRSSHAESDNSPAGQQGICACPRADVAEQSDKFVITAEMPGVRKENLTVRVEDGVLHLRGTRDVSTQEDARVILRERRSDEFARSFRLPDVVDQSKIEAQLADGMLRLELPKADHALAREIKVQ